MKPVLENRFDYKGFTCVVLFMPMGYRCGYVGLPLEHKYAGEDYDDIPVDCHCGLTYSSGHLVGQIMPRWWIGFDCGHCCDGYDIDCLNSYYSDDGEVMKQLRHMKSYYEETNKAASIRTLEYCESECKKIVDQIVELNNA